jgi:hypothetical protein
MLAQNARPRENNLSNNPYLDFAQALGPGPVSVPTSGYGPDGVISEFGGGGTLSYSRIGGSGAENGARFTKGGAAGKAFLAAPIESGESLSKSGIEQIFQAALSGNVPRTLHMGLIGSSAPVNALPKPIVTAFNAVGFNPTLDPAYSYIFELGVGVGAGFGTFGVATTPGSVNNLLAAVWSDDVIGIGGTLDISSLGMFMGNAFRNNESPPRSAELSAAQRFFEKSYNPDTAPGTVTDIGAFAFRASGAVPGENVFIPFKQSKRATPAITLLNPTTGAAGTWRDTTAGANIVVAAANIGLSGFEVTIGGGLVMAGALIRGHWTADARL